MTATPELMVDHRLSDSRQEAVRLRDAMRSEMLDAIANEAVAQGVEIPLAMVADMVETALERAALAKARGELA